MKLELPKLVIYAAEVTGLVPARDTSIHYVVRDKEEAVASLATR